MVDESDEGDGEEGFDEEEKAALRMLSPEKKKHLAELESAGANRIYIKKWLRKALLQQQQE